MPSVRYVYRDGKYQAPGLPDIPVGGDPGYPTTPTPMLPFNLPTRQAIVGFDKRVWAHAFVTFPLGGDGRANRTSWYTDRMPGGTQNTAYGGELRDRPLDPFPRPRTESAWYILDRAQEILWAREAGLHGFTVDWLNLNDGTGDNRTGQVREYAEAIMSLGVQNDFKMILMPDGTTSICDGANLDAFVAKTVDLFKDYPDVWHRHEGKYVVFAYYPEGAPNSNPGSGRVTNTSASATAAYWSSYKNKLAAAGYDVRLWFCYVRSWYNHATAALALSGIGEVNSRWGDRDPVNSAGTGPSNAGAPAYSLANFGKPWIHPVSTQDNRVNVSESPKYWEAGNTENLRATWRIAIDGNIFGVQIPTWSDIREHAHMFPSKNHGRCWLDINAYYMTRYLSGAWPTIERDTIYLSHRIHRSSGYTITGTQTNIMARVGGTPARDNVEALVFLRDTTNVQVQVTAGGVTTTFTPGPSYKVLGGPGVYAFNVGLPTSGTVSARVLRNGLEVAQVTSQHTIANSVVAQDMQYRLNSSLRGAY